MQNNCESETLLECCTHHLSLHMAASRIDIKLDCLGWLRGSNHHTELP